MLVGEKVERSLVSERLTRGDVNNCDLSFAFAFLARVTGVNQVTNGVLHFSNFIV